MPYEGLVRFRSHVSGMMYDNRASAGDAEGLWDGKTRMVESALDQPLRWKRPRKIFVNSMSDLFHETMTDGDIERVFRVMSKASHHTFQILTKRPERMAEWVVWGERIIGHPWPLPNVWLGVSVENQEAADERIPLLLETPATVRFLSCEPLLGSVNIMRWLHSWPVSSKTNPQDECNCEGKLHWVIVGGESGPGSRVMFADWARELRDQCSSARVPFFFKQWGEWAPQVLVQDEAEEWHLADPRLATGEQAGQASVRIGKRAAGSILDGREHKEFPR